MATRLDAQREESERAWKKEAGQLHPGEFFGVRRAASFLEMSEGAPLPKSISEDEFLTLNLEGISHKNKIDFLAHLARRKNKDEAHRRLKHLNLVAPTLKEPDIQIEHYGKLINIKAFNDENGKLYFILITSKGENKSLVTAIPTRKLKYITKKIEEADLIQRFIGGETVPQLGGINPARLSGKHYTEAEKKEVNEIKQWGIDTGGYDEGGRLVKHNHKVIEAIHLLFDYGEIIIKDRELPYYPLYRRYVEALNAKDLNDLAIIANDILEGRSKREDWSKLYYLTKGATDKYDKAPHSRPWLNALLEDPNFKERFDTGFYEKQFLEYLDRLKKEVEAYGYKKGTPPRPNQPPPPPHTLHRHRMRQIGGGDLKDFIKMPQKQRREGLIFLGIK